MILDCNSREKALKTVAEIHGAQKDTLQTFFDRWPPHRLENPAGLMFEHVTLK